MTLLKMFGAGLLNYLWNNIITHIPIHAFRKAFLRIVNRKISKSSVILLHVRILNFWSVEIGDRVVINQYALLDCRKHKVIIANDVDIGPYCRIWTLGHDVDSNSHGVRGGDVVIGHHVWLASSVTLLPCIELGAGAVVGSGAVVSKNIPAMEVWSGVPAKFVRRRKNDLRYKLNYVPYFE